MLVILPHGITWHHDVPCTYHVSIWITDQRIQHTFQILLDKLRSQMPKSVAKKCQFCLLVASFESPFLAT